MLRRPLAWIALLVILVVVFADSALAQSTTVVISEFRTGGSGGGNDEFIELLNISSSPVNISGWKVKGSNNTGGGTSPPRATIPANTILEPGQFYLLTNSNGYSGSVPGNQTYGTGISDNGGIALTLANDQLVDQVGMSAGSAFQEGTPLPTFPGSNSTNQSRQRKPGGCSGGTQDTDDNTADFLPLGPSDPQNLASNRLPAAAAGPVTTLEDMLSAAISGDPRDASQTIASVTILALPTNGTLESPAGNTIGTGTFAVADVFYRPNMDFFGSDSFSYQVTDSGTCPNISAPSTVTVNVTPVNDRPTFTKGPNQTATKGDVQQTVVGWATSLSKGPANEASQNLVGFTLTPDDPTVFDVPPAVDVTTGTLTYTPSTANTGTATITITLQDDGGTADGGLDTSLAQMFTITINDVNQPPTFTVGANQTVDEDAGAQTVPDWATGVSAPEPGQTVTFMITGNTNPSLFSAGPTVTTTGTTATLAYTPTPNVSGSATITLVAKDDGGTALGGMDTSAPQMFTITVNPVNDPPTFTIPVGTATTTQNSGPQTRLAFVTQINAGAPDEAGQTLTFNVMNNNNTLFSAQPTLTIQGGDPTQADLAFTPAMNQTGMATVTVTLSDGQAMNGTSAAQMFTIEVTPVNQQPTFTVQTPNQTVNEDAGAQTVTSWATSISAPEQGQVVTFMVTGNTNTALFSAGPAVSVSGSNGNLTYTPATNANGSATITIVAKDDGGTQNGGVDTSAPLTFTITVNPVNDPPSFTKGPNQSVVEDAGPQSVSGWATAISAGPGESGQTVTFTVTNDNNTLFSAQPAVASNGTLTYTPAADANGSATVSVTAMDDGGVLNGGVNQSAAQTFTITVTPAADAPVAGNLTVTTGEEESVSFVLPGSDPDGDAVTFTVTQPPTNGSLGGTAPNLTFTPETYFTGTVQLGFTVSNSGGSAAGTVTIVVAPAEGRLVATLENPEPPGADRFGTAITAVGTTLFAVGAPLDDRAAAVDTGSVYVFDAASGAPTLTIPNPGGADGDQFGAAIAALGGKLLIGAPATSVGGQAGAGAAYVIDATTGMVDRVILNPAASAGAGFGSAVAVDPTRNEILVGTPRAMLAGMSAGAVYIFDATTGAFVRVLDNPDPATGDRFGAAIATGSVFIGAPGDASPGGSVDRGALHSFDSATGMLLFTTPGLVQLTGAGFGASVATVPQGILVGAPASLPFGGGRAGQAMLVARTTGGFLFSITNPTPAAGDEFGARVALAGTLFAISAPRAPLGNFSGTGVVHLVDGGSGRLVRTIENPTPASGDDFGRGLAALGSGTLAIGAPEATSAGVGSAGVVQVIAINLRPVAIPQSIGSTGGALNIRLGATDANGDSLTFRVVTPPTNGSLNGTPPNLAYTPNPGSRTDSFTFVADDGRLTSLPATISIGTFAAGGIGGGGGCAASEGRGATSPTALLPVLLGLAGLLLIRRRLRVRAARASV